MQIGATICGFLAGVIFALVVFAIPPAVIEFQHDARMALTASCHVLDADFDECREIVAGLRRETDTSGDCGS